MIDTTQVINAIADSLSTMKTVVQPAVDMSQIIVDVAPLLVLLGAALVVSVILFITRDKRK